MAVSVIVLLGCEQLGKLCHSGSAQSAVVNHITSSSGSKSLPSLLWENGGILSDRGKSGVWFGFLPHESLHPRPEPSQTG